MSVDTAHEALHPGVPSLHDNASFVGRQMLTHISKHTQALPANFYETVGESIVQGQSTALHAVISLEEPFVAAGEGAYKLTDIVIDRNSTNPDKLRSLVLIQKITDEYCENHGIEVPESTFELGADDNTVNLWGVMWSTRRAVSLLDKAQAART